MLSARASPLCTTPSALTVRGAVLLQDEAELMQTALFRQGAGCHLSLGMLPSTIRTSPGVDLNFFFFPQTCTHVHTNQGFRCRCTAPPISAANTGAYNLGGSFCFYIPKGRVRIPPSQVCGRMAEVTCVPRASLCFSCLTTTTPTPSLALRNSRLSRLQPYYRSVLPLSPVPPH